MNNITPQSSGQTAESDPLQSSSLSEEQQLYKENILDHYKRPRNKRVLENATVTHAGRNPLCGDVITVSLVLENDVVVDVAFQGAGCAVSQASMSMLSDDIKGKSIDAVRALGKDDIVALLGIPIGPVRLKCALLGLRTTQDAIGSIEQKNIENTTRD
jgi:nitrogen fixation NifU-like protein